jgi:predicted CopG family antitoxin
MATVSTGDFLHSATLHMRFLQQLLGENDESQRKHQSLVKSLEQTRDEALNELAALYLPAWTRESFAPIPALTGYRQFEVNSPFEEAEQRRQRLSSLVATIESDERYRRREQLLDPVAGELTLKVAEAEKQLKFFNDSLSPYKEEPEFLGLVERGYDTVDYSVTWSELRYYSDWKYGDLIAEKFGKQSFREVLDDYLRLKEARDEYKNDFLAVKKEKGEVEDLIENRAQALSGLETLEADTLNACRQQLREHLAYIDRDELVTWSAASADVVGVIKRVHGIEKKIEYLDELTRRYLHTEREQLIAAMTKLNAKVEKYSRPKHAYSVIPYEETSRWLKGPTEKLGARRDRFQESYRRVYEFDRYDVYDYARDMLWWDLMTDGRIDGDFIPEVQAWREQHPGGSRILESDITGAGSSEPAQSADLTDLGGMVDVS